MKILIIQPWIRIGGAELVSVHLAYKIQESGHKAQVVALFVEMEGLPHEAEEVEYILPPKALRVLCSKSRVFFLIFAPFLLFYLVLRNCKDTDVLNPHNFPSLWIAIAIGTLKRIPVIWTCNEPPTPISIRDIAHVGIADYIGWLLASSPLDRFFVRRVSIIHVLSQKTKLEVKHRYDKDAVIIRTGVDFRLFREASSIESKSKYGLNGKFVLLVVSKLHPQKNLIVCMEALKQILSHIPNAVLLIVGSGPMRQELEHTTKKLGLTNHVCFIGQVLSDELPSLYAACDINLFPAKNQSWGLTPFEALCVKRISIVSADSGAAEVLLKERIGLVSEAKPNEFAMRIRKVHANPEAYQQMAHRGFIYVSKNLTHTSFSRSFLNLAQGVSQKQQTGKDEETLIPERTPKT
jgi:glycosyltransferase involved in cell wall biosynthesis